MKHPRLAAVLTAVLAIVAADADARPTPRARRIIRLTPSADADANRARGVVRTERRRGATFTTAVFRGLAPDTTYALTWGEDRAFEMPFVTNRAGRARLRRTRMPTSIDARAASVTVLEDGGAEVLTCDPDADHADGSSHGDHHDVDWSWYDGHMDSSHHDDGGHGWMGWGGGGGMHGGGGMMKR